MLGARRVQLIDKIADETGDAALAMPMDGTDEASVISAHDKAEARFDTVDTVIANAGVDGSGDAGCQPVRHLSDRAGGGKANDSCKDNQRSGAADLFDYCPAVFRRACE
jgi:NAD(P)-dependent dehydrogenase (short-subunit alcohol dehydrogenase family)